MNCKKLIVAIIGLGVSAFTGSSAMAHGGGGGGHGGGGFGGGGFHGGGFGGGGFRGGSFGGFRGGFNGGGVLRPVFRGGGFAGSVPPPRLPASFLFLSLFFVPSLSLPRPTH